VIRLLPILLLAGCGVAATHEARDPRGALIGHNIRDAVLCAGLPDKWAAIGSDAGQAEWSFKGTSPAFSIAAPFLGSVSIGSPPSCRMDMQFLRDGTVVGVSFPQCTGTLFDGPDAAAGTLAGNCLRHLDDASVPTGFDAVAQFIPTKP
jgi:hypothetical protein